MPTANEKELLKDSALSYLEPTQVPLGEKPQACRVQRRLGKSANWRGNFGRTLACASARMRARPGRSDQVVATVL
jgi:hypothetical protein